MAFRTNKVPVLQTKSASGAVATFNTALAMPLASCNIAVNAWQEGSGDPSPSNVRPIHGFSEVNLTANNVVHTIQLGQEVYGGYLDVDSGLLTINKRIVYFDDIPSDNWIYDERFTRWRTNIVVSDYYHNQTTNDLTRCDILATGNDLNVISYFLDGSARVYVRNTGITDKSVFLSLLAGHYLICTQEPQTIQLTPTQIATIRGNNTIFADTGDIDLTFKDLDIAKRGNFREVFRLPS